MVSEVKGIEGYEVPIHQSLVEPLLFGGCPRTYALINGTITAALGIGMQQYYMFAVGIGLHFIGALAAKSDPDFFDILTRHIKEKPYLEP